MRLSIRPPHDSTAFFIARGRPARRVAPWGRASWGKGDVLMRMWWRRSVGYIARSWRWARKRERRCGRAPSGADELGDAVQPVFVEVVDRAVAQ